MAQLATNPHLPAPIPFLTSQEPIEEIPLPISYEEFSEQNPLDDVEPQPQLDQHELSWPQYFFVTSPAKFPAMVAGYGAGKTEAGIIRALKLKFDNPDLNIGYYLPTYDLIKQIVFPRFEELLTQYGYKYFLNTSDKELVIYGMKGKFIFRTMDKPERIIGYEHAHAICDELDTLKIDKAAEVWRKIVARNRQKLPHGERNTVGVVTTPEGYRFVYARWKKAPLRASQIIKASTYSNIKNLPEDYIETLKDTFPEQQLQAYLEGEFVNMTQGSVYPDFDRDLNNCGTTVEDKETLHIGVDFNVGQMAATVHVFRDEETHAVDELVMYLDTPALIEAIKTKYPGHRIVVYPDASGKSRKTTNASESDLALLRQAGFLVLAKSKNPFVKDRVAAFNKHIHKNGKRLYKVNVNACPHLTECLEKQAYDKNGEPDKTSGFDHTNDSAGYFIAYRFPIQHGRVRKTTLKGT